ncbi:putative lysophosphatidylcholine acyltransferase [Termitomyces sp. T112]|nr:putative lysophosphatidylcholine acyltransferase [Termitomyces sp. T112]
MSAFVSTATVTTVGLACKAFLNLGYCSLTVSGLHHLHDTLSSPARNAGQGLITVANHISTLDDPVAWGVLPTRYYLSRRTTRWTLASIFSAFFRHGQTIETFRGKGVHQPAVDTAIQKLDQGGWVHLFSEGKVNQPEDYPRDESGVARLPRFKWGVGRILMETLNPPVIIPMWLTGFDKLMPEGRAFPWKFLPRYGAQLSVTFGSPIPPEEVLEALGTLSTKLAPHDTVQPTIRVKDQISQLQAPYMAQEDLSKTRSAVTAIIQQRVEALGRSICGDTLTQ